MGAGSLRSRCCYHGQIWVRTLFQVADCRLIIFSHGIKKARELSNDTFIRAQIPFLRALTS